MTIDEAKKIVKKYHIDCSKVLDGYEMPEFYDVTVNRYGDVITYRIYKDGSNIVIR